jgi:hypothetical protein
VAQMGVVRSGSGATAVKNRCSMAQKWMRGKEGKRKGPREEKKGVGFQTRLTDELRRTVPHPPWPPRIFVGWATSPMNLCILSSSVTRPNRRIYG